MPWTEDTQWDLDVFLAGGPAGDAFQARMAALEARVRRASSAADALGDPAEDAAWDEVIPALMAIEDEVAELYSFAVCHSAAASTDPAAHRAEGLIGRVATWLERAWINPVERVARCSEASFQALCARPAHVEYLAMYQDTRASARLLLPPAEQALYTELSEDGLHAWGRSYERRAGSLIITLGEERLSPAQASNRLESQDAAVRAAAFDGIEAAWASVADDCAEALSHIYGSRAVLYKRLGVDPLEDPLTRNRMQRETFDALMVAAQEAAPLVDRYLKAKARFLGRSHLDWCDLRAPLGEAGDVVAYADAQDLVATTFGSFSPEMGEFVQRAFTDRWVEAEDRRGKRPGAFCTGFPLSRQSRVFMTYGGGLKSVLCLAHELGHAFHNHALLAVNPARRRVPSNLAETASTFGEALVRGAALERSQDRAALLAILDQDLGDAVSFLANIPVRVEFELALYALRASGDLEPAALSARMEALQRQWYGPTLGRAHPLFWAEKLHFYLSSAPFYNFPYTFGYLFSSLVYSRALTEGSRWAEGYNALLRDTGAGTAEDLAQRHLGVDLRDPATWRPVLAGLAARADQFEALVDASAQSPS